MKKYAARDISVAIVGTRVTDRIDSRGNRYYHFEQKESGRVKVCIRKKSDRDYPRLLGIDDNIMYYYFSSNYAEGPVYAYEVPLSDYINCELTDKFTIKELYEIQKDLNVIEENRNEKNIFKWLEILYQELTDKDDFDKFAEEYYKYAKNVLDSLVLIKEDKTDNLIDEANDLLDRINSSKLERIKNRRVYK